MKKTMKKSSILPNKSASELSMNYSQVNFKKEYNSTAYKKKHSRINSCVSNSDNSEISNIYSKTNSEISRLVKKKNENINFSYRR